MTLMKLNLFETHTFYNDYKRLETRRERGEFIKDLSDKLGIHSSTLHRNFNELKKGKSTSNRKDKGVPRYKDMTEFHAKLAAQKVAAMKMEMATKDDKTAETGRIVHALYHAGELPYIIPTSTMNRWLNWYGYSYRQMKNYAASTGCRLTTDEPNKWWFVDSSVSELYYLTKNGNIKRDNTGIITDKNHREEILTKKGLRKLLIFGVVDLFSDAYWFNAYVTPGESATAWTMFFMDAFQKKEDANNPFRGIPQNIYSDRGSGLKNSQVEEMFESLGIKFWDHLPGNAKAKGRIEARIGAYKNSIERTLAFEKIGSLERYREITQKMIVADNIKRGFYARWMDIHKMDGALKEFNPELRQKVGYSWIERKVNPYGCISLDNVEYFVSRRLHGEYVSIYSLFDGTMKATDRLGNIYDIQDITHQYREMGTYKANKKTEYDYDLKAIKEHGKKLRKKIQPEHFLDEVPENVVIFDREGAEVEVVSPFDVEKITSVDDAWYRVYKTTGYAQQNLPTEVSERIDEIFHAMILIDGEIKGEKFSEILEFITDEIREAGVL